MVEDSFLIENSSGGQMINHGVRAMWWPHHLPCAYLLTVEENDKNNINIKKNNVNHIPVRITLFSDCWLSLSNH